MMNADEQHKVSIFFFQAEDGIRDIGVTGVQTCALPIFRSDPMVIVAGDSGVGKSSLCRAAVAPQVEAGALSDGEGPRWTVRRLQPGRRQIGRASCRVRV